MFEPAVRVATLGALVVFASGCGGKLEDEARPPGETAGREERGSPREPAPGETPGIARSGCGLQQPVRADSEGVNPLASSWSVTGGAHLQIERSAPITGAQSIRFDPAPSVPTFFTVPLPPVCSVTVTFTLRATRDLVQRQSTLVRVVGTRTSTSLQVRDRAIWLEEVTEAGGPGHASGGGLDELDADVETTVRPVVDLSKRRASVNLVPKGAPMPEPRWRGWGMGKGELAGSFVAVEIGSQPDFGQPTAGAYVLDGLSID